MVVGGGAFNRICGAGKKVPPEGLAYELQEWEDASRSRWGVSGGLGTEKKKREEALAKGIACFIESVI